MSWCNPTGKVAGCGLDNQVLIPGRGRDFSLHHVQINSGAHPASYSNDTRDSFLWE